MDARVRVQSVDLFRGLMIIWCIFVHMSLNFGVIQYSDTSPSTTIYDVLSFFMTPFYFISGYFFSSRRDLKEFVSNKAKKLVVPYLFWGLVSVLVYYLFMYITTGEIVFTNLFKISTGGLVSNTPLWFFFSLFFVNIIYYAANLLINKYNRTGGGKIIDSFIFLCFCFSFLVHNKLALFSCGNIALGLVYFHFGFRFKQLAKQRDVLKKTFLISSIIVFSIIVVFNNQNLWFSQLVQAKGFFILNLPFSLSAIYILWYVTDKVSKLWMINYIGEYSLVYFACHRILLN